MGKKDFRVTVPSPRAEATARSEHHIGVIFKLSVLVRSRTMTLCSIKDTHVGPNRAEKIDVFLQGKNREIVDGKNETR